jgi:hypothetical protein
MDRRSRRKVRELFAKLVLITKSESVVGVDFAMSTSTVPPRY